MAGPGRSDACASPLFRLGRRPTDPSAEAGPQDYVIVALKAHTVAPVAEKMAPLLGPKTAVVMAVNGVPWWYFHGLEGPLKDRRIPMVDPGDRSTAAGLSNLPLQVLSSAGPTIAGQLMQSVWVSLPLELAAGLQAVNTLLYHAFFHRMRLPEERERAAMEVVARDDDARRSD